MRRDRPSLTASLVASIRALYTALPAPYDLAPDPVAAELLPAILTVPARVAALSGRAGPAFHRAVRAATLGLSQHVALRTRAIDDALREGVARGATQLVVLGAGLDSRAERLAELAGVRVFEVDHPSTHRFKAERLLRAGTRLRAQSIARVAIDFERDRLHDVLRAAGFDPAARSFWIWEGVTVYLTPEATLATLRAVAEPHGPVRRERDLRQHRQVRRGRGLPAGRLGDDVRGSVVQQRSVHHGQHLQRERHVHHRQHRGLHRRLRLRERDGVQDGVRRRQ